jgi:hypothetical protein
LQTIQRSRLKSGQFAPDQSGNSGGRPKDEHCVAELARSYTIEAIDTLVELMRGGKDERLRGTAAQALRAAIWTSRRRFMSGYSSRGLMIDLKTEYFQDS